MMLRCFVTACLLFSGVTALGDERLTPEPSVVVRLRFDGKPMRVVVDTKGHAIKDVRWAVGRLYESYDGILEPETANDVLLQANSKELYNAIHKELPLWDSWNHKVDPREPVDLVFHGINPTAGGFGGDWGAPKKSYEQDSWAGVTITARPYGGKVLAELLPYYTEFKEAPKPRQRRVNRNRGGQLQERQTQETADTAISVFGPRLREGEMVRVPANLKVLEAQASQKFDEDVEMSSSEDPRAAKRQWGCCLISKFPLYAMGYHCASMWKRRCCRRILRKPNRRHTRTLCSP